MTGATAATAGGLGGPVSTRPALPTPRPRDLGACDLRQADALTSETLLGKLDLAGKAWFALSTSLDPSPATEDALWGRLPDSS